MAHTPISLLYADLPTDLNLALSAVPRGAPEANQGYCPPAHPHVFRHVHAYVFPSDFSSDFSSTFTGCLSRYFSRALPGRRCISRCRAGFGARRSPALDGLERRFEGLPLRALLRVPQGLLQGLSQGYHLGFSLEYPLDFSLELQPDIHQDSCPIDAIAR